MPRFLDPQKTRRFGFMLRHRALWVSELLASVFVALFLVGVFSMTLIILLNSYTIHTLDRSIDALKSGHIQMTHAIEKLRQEAHVLSVMQRLAGHGIADTTLCQVASLVCASSNRFGYDPLLLVAVIRVEGVFNPEATGRFRSGAPSGALGLMQLKFTTAQEVARQLEMSLERERDLLNPEINLVLGVAYLTQLINRFQSFKLGLLAYNQGPQAVRQTLTNRDTLSLAYYRKVLRHYYTLQRMAAAPEMR